MRDVVVGSGDTFLAACLLVHVCQWWLLLPAVKLHLPQMAPVTPTCCAVRRSTTHCSVAMSWCFLMAATTCTYLIRPALVDLVLVVMGVLHVAAELTEYR